MKKLSGFFLDVHILVFQFFNLRRFIIICFFSVLFSNLYSQQVVEKVFYHEGQVYGMTAEKFSDYTNYQPMKNTLGIGFDGGRIYSRGYLIFDISSIPVGAKIVSASLKMEADPGKYGGVDLMKITSPLKSFNSQSDWADLFGSEKLATEYINSSRILEVKNDKLISFLSSSVNSNKSHIEFGLLTSHNSTSPLVSFIVYDRTKIKFAVTYSLDVPVQPSGLSIVDMSNNSCTISWKKVTPNVSGYKIYSNGVVVASVASGVTSYELLNLDSNRQYSLSVSAFNSAGESKISEKMNVLTKPSVPTSLSSSHIDCGKYKVEWKNNDFSVVGLEYVIYLNGSERTRTKNAFVELEALVDHQSYDVKVKAVNTSGESVLSGVCRFQTVSSVVPFAPTSPSIWKIPVAGVGYLLSWKDDLNVDVERYRIIERSPNSGEVGSVTQKNILLNFLLDNTMYIFSISAERNKCRSKDLTWGFHTGYLKSSSILDTEQDFQDPGSQESSFPESFVVFPNPVKNYLSVQNIEDFMFQIYTYDGVLVLKGMSSNGGIDVANLTSGFYVLRITVKENWKSVKFFKE